MNRSDMMIVRDQWNPSETQLTKYLKRELELARVNLRPFTGSVAKLRPQCLHSEYTLSMLCNERHIHFQRLEQFPVSRGAGTMLDSYSSRAL